MIIIISSSSTLSECIILLILKRSSLDENDVENRATAKIVQLISCCYFFYGCWLLRLLLSLTHPVPLSWSSSSSSSSLFCVNVSRSIDWFTVHIVTVPGIQCTPIHSSHFTWISITLSSNFFFRSSFVQTRVAKYSRSQLLDFIWLRKRTQELQTCL